MKLTDYKQSGNLQIKKLYITCKLNTQSMSYMFVQRIFSSSIASKSVCGLK